MTKNRFTIKDEILHKIGKQIDKQIEKGVPKYNHTLDDCAFDSFEWLLMQNEELVDGLQYANKEIRRQRNTIKKLERLIADGA